MTNTMTTTDTYISEVRWGDIVLIDFGEQPEYEQAGVRPALVIQNNKGNQASPAIIVCAITSQNKRRLPTHVQVNIEDNTGLQKQSIILAEQVRTVSKKRIIKKCGSVIDTLLVEKIQKALTISFGL